MSTKAPVRRVYDIPIENPAPAKANPLSLPAPEPDRWFTPAPREPAKIPVRQR
jgi:hypothetical protein